MAFCAAGNKGVGPGVNNRFLMSMVVFYWTVTA